MKELGMSSNDVDISAQILRTIKPDFTPTKLLEQKIKTFIRDYYNTISISLINTISENIKASDRWSNVETHYQKIHLKDQLSF